MKTKQEGTTILTLYQYLGEWSSCFSLLIYHSILNTRVLHHFKLHTTVLSVWWSMCVCLPCLIPFAQSFCLLYAPLFIHFHLHCISSYQGAAFPILLLVDMKLHPAWGYYKQRGPERCCIRLWGTCAQGPLERYYLVKFSAMMETFCICVGQLSGHQYWAFEIWPMQPKSLIFIYFT